MIEVKFSNESVIELQSEMRQLLEGDSRANGVSNPPSGQTSGSVGVTETAPKRQTAAEKKAAEKAAAQNISTGGERTDPAVDAQDAKDEATETAATKPVDLTHDDLKNMMSGYVQAYGLDMAQADGPAFIGVPKISEVPNTQAALAKAILGVAEGIDKNPNKRDLVGDGVTAEKITQMKLIVTAARAVK